MIIAFKLTREIRTSFYVYEYPAIPTDKEEILHLSGVSIWSSQNTYHKDSPWNCPVRLMSGSEKPKPCQICAVFVSVAFVLQIRG